MVVMLFGRTMLVKPALLAKEEPPRAVTVFPSRAAGTVMAPLAPAAFVIVALVPDTV